MTVKVDWICGDCGHKNYSDRNHACENCQNEKSEKELIKTMSKI